MCAFRPPRRRWRLVWRAVVEGSSMEPALSDGDRVLLVPPVGVRVGHIVALADPRDDRGLLIKRVQSIDDQAQLVEVRGDNAAASTDGRTFGPVPRTELLGRVAFRYSPRGGGGPISPGG